MRDMASRMDVRQLFPPVAAVTDNTVQTSSIIDLAGFETCTLLLNFGTLTDADATFTTLVEHGDAANMSDAATPAAAELIGTAALASATFADDNKVKKIGYVGSKRYLRVKVTPAANSGNLFLSGQAVLTGGRFNPQANPPA